MFINITENLKTKSAQSNYIREFFLARAQIKLHISDVIQFSHMNTYKPYFISIKENNMNVFI